MKTFYLILFLILNRDIYCQINESLKGSWLKTKMETYDGRVTSQIKDLDLKYLKYTFENEGNLKISVHYTSNGNNQKYTLKGNILELEFNRKLLIEKVDSLNLVLIDLENSNLTPNSVKISFVKEQSYLDKLPLDVNDRIIKNYDTCFFECEKLYPRFKNNDFSDDFRNYINNALEGCSKAGTYFYATFIILPNGKIDEINILHHVNKTFDYKALKAIQNSREMWVLPKFNGNVVPIIKILEIRYSKNTEVSKIDYTNLTNPEFGNYSEEYFDNFNSLAHAYLNNDYQKTLEYINDCEEINPKEPNLFFLKYICYEKLGNTDSSLLNREMLKKTELKYLTK